MGILQIEKLDGTPREKPAEMEVTPPRLLIPNLNGISAEFSFLCWNVEACPELGEVL